MITVIVNIDQDWDFCALARRHGVDLYRDSALSLWDVRPQRRPRDKVWPDWPREVLDDELSTEVEETIVDPILQDPDQNLLLIFLISCSLAATIAQEGSTPGDGPVTAGLREDVSRSFGAKYLDSLNTRLGKLRFDHRKIHRVLALRPNVPTGVLASLMRLVRQGQLDEVVVIGRLQTEGLSQPQAEERRFLTLRALMACYNDPDSHAEWANATRAAQMKGVYFPLRFHLEGTALVSGLPPMLQEADTLLQECIAHVRKHGETHVAQQPETQISIENVLAEIEALVQAIPHLKRDTQRPEMPAPLRSARMREPSMEAAITAHIKEFQAWLEGWLTQEAELLHVDLARQRQENDRRHETIRTSLKKNSGEGQGLTDSVIDGLRHQLNTLKEQRTRLSQTTRVLFRSMCGGATSEGRLSSAALGAGEGGYVRPQFAEDENLDKAGSEALAAVAGLGDRSRFWSTAAKILLCAPLPALLGAGGVLAGGGAFPTSFIGAALWLAVPAIVACCALVVQTRKKAARFHGILDGLTIAEFALSERTGAALVDTRRYCSHTTALRRLNLLIEHLEHRLEHLRRTDDILKCLENVFSGAKTHHGGNADALRASFKFLKDELQKQPCRRWLDTLLKRWPTMDDVELTLRDRRIATKPGQIRAHFLHDCDAICIEMIDTSPEAPA